MFQKDQVINNYRITSDATGGGGYGLVFMGEDINSKQPVALKVCKQDCTEDDANRFVRENRILYKLFPHTGIVIPYSHILVENSISFYAMELADCDLNKYLNVNYQKLNLRNKLDIFIKICEGLQHSHDEKVVHRDLHWNNVLLKSIESIDEPKLCDFGRAKDFDEVRKFNYQPQQVAVAPAIHPPENRFKIWNEAELNKYIYADMYSLGILLYFIFEGYASGYSAIIHSEIDRFFAEEKIRGINSLEVSEREKLYTKWTDKFNPNIIDNYLSIRIIDRNLENNLNNIIKNLCSPNYKDRYENVNSLLEDLKVLNL